MSETPTSSTLAGALLAAQEEMPAVDKDGINPHFKSNFTTLGNLLKTVVPILNKNGLVLVQAPTLVDGTACLRTTILHGASGESMEFDAPLGASKPDPQGQGSAITYMRRYSLAAALAISDQEDDDGNAATRSPDIVGFPAATEEDKDELRIALKDFLPADEAKAVWGEVKQKFGGELYAPAAQAVVAVIEAKKALD